MNTERLMFIQLKPDIYKEYKDTDIFLFYHSLKSDQTFLD